MVLLKILGVILGYTLDKWQTRSIPYSTLTPEEDLFLDKYSTNKKKSIDYLISLSGLSYKEVVEQNCFFKSDKINPSDEYKIPALNIFMQRCFPQKDYFHDNLLTESLDNFIELVGE